MILFNGHDLTELFVCGDPKISILESSVSYASTPSADGSAVLSRRWANSTVSFTVVAIGDASERRHAFSTLGSWLDVDEPKPLVLPDTPNLGYLAVPDDGVELKRMVGGESGKLRFAIVEPAAYGQERTITVPSGGSVTFNVGGTYPTRPSIVAASAVRNASSKVWGIRLDGGDFIHIATGSASARRVEVDCRERTCLVESSATLPTLDSDWLELAPGAHTLRNDQGSGACTVTYDERWL